MRKVYLFPAVGLLMILVAYQGQYAQTPSKTEPASHADWFSHQPVLGELPPEKQNEFLATLNGSKGNKPTLGLTGDPRKIVYTTTEHQSHQNAKTGDDMGPARKIREEDGTCAIKAGENS